MNRPSRRTITIDCNYLEPRFAAAYLLIDGDQAAFVDNNTAYSVPELMSALKREALSPEQVRYVIITHVHLDHAGGTSALMKLCPNATLLAHPRAARHMIDPSKLVSSAVQVYGEERFRALYGEIGPIEASRVREMADRETIEFGTGKLEFIHTRGHANHHFCIWDPGAGEIFTGDSFGLCYPDLQANGLFVFPSTSPTDFDAALAKESLRKIVGTGARVAYLTHFGGVTDLEGAATQLDEHLDFSEALLKESQNSSCSDVELERFCRERLDRHYRDVFTRLKIQSEPKLWKLIEMDLELNAQGLAWVAAKQRKSTASGSQLS